MMLRTLADAVLAVTLAPTCAGCSGALERPLDGLICDSCWASIRAPVPPLCRTCGDSLPSWRTVSGPRQHCARCRRSPRAVDAGCAAGEYAGALREIVHAFKYDGRRSLAGALGRLLRARAGHLLEGAHCAVPVPLHPWRRFRRGFNQSADLARETGLPVLHALWRTRATVPQASLPTAARHRNVRDAFVLSPLVSTRRRAALLAGRTVVIVDDVRTTGATLEACARVLKGAGAREVRALTVAGAALTGHGRDAAGSAGSPRLDRTPNDWTPAVKHPHAWG